MAILVPQTTSKNGTSKNGQYNVWVGVRRVGYRDPGMTTEVSAATWQQAKQHLDGRCVPSL